MWTRSKKINIQFKTMIFAAISFLILALAILIGPMDFFWHGYYASEVDMSAAGAAGAALEPVDLVSGEARMRFSPAGKGLAGFEFYLSDRPAGSGEGIQGVLSISIESKMGGY